MRLLQELLEARKVIESRGVVLTSLGEVGDAISRYRIKYRS